MKKMSLLLTAVLLSACEKPMPFESAEALLANPERLKELGRQCKEDWDKLGNVQCNAVTEAERKRFMGKGTPYTPYPVKFFNSDTKDGR
jgi:hypothetical protein